MKFSKKALTALLLATGVCVANGALAGPSVTITFKNLSSTANATYSILGTNESITNTNASPKPVVTVLKGAADSYTVSSQLLNVTFANVRYTIGTKSCVFLTTFVATSSATGDVTPKWSKNVTADSGVTCNATITSTNPTTYAWNVEFTMK